MTTFHMDNRAQRVLDLFNLDKGQINISTVNSTTHIVAWHMHKIQTDYFYCLKGSFQVGYLPVDKNSGLVNSRDNIFRYISDKDPTNFIEIPPYTYHGYKALEPGSVMLYYLSEKYNPNDEYNKKPGDFGEDWGTENK